MRENARVSGAGDGVSTTVCVLVVLQEWTDRSDRELVSAILQHGARRCVPLDYRSASSPLLLPFKTFERASFHLHDPSRMHDLPSPPWAFTISIFTPSWSERPVAAVTSPVTGVWDFLGGYTGVSLVALLVMVLPRWRFRNRAEALFLAGAA